MPTPFYHINIAEDLLKHPGLASNARRVLEQYQCEFIFGHTAPDVQVISGQEREVTHFFILPIQKGSPLPWELILEANPSLRYFGQLPPAQASFLAGYLCHLQADWFWIRDVFAPIFGPTCSWGTFPERLYLHNVLRAYLDQQVYKTSPDGISTCLCQVSPVHWLPFVEDHYLGEWQDFLTLQLQPGAVAQTVEVFAARQGIEPDEFYHLIDSEERMDEEVFVHLPRQKLDRYRQSLVVENLKLLRSSFEQNYAVSQRTARPLQTGKQV